MSEEIFINYRRSDSGGYALMVAERLKQRFGAERVFTDIDAIRPGRKFREQIDEALGTCRVALVVIGPGWLATRGEERDSRLHDHDDVVRAEIASALRGDVAVIPVLVGDASMPDRDQLPEAIRELADFQAVEITAKRLDDDLADLVAEVERLLEDPADDGGVTTRSADRADPGPDLRRLVPYLVAGVLGLAIIAGTYLALSGGDEPGGPASPDEVVAFSQPTVAFASTEIGAPSRSTVTITARGAPFLFESVSARPGAAFPKPDQEPRCTGGVFIGRDVTECELFASFDPAREGITRGELIVGYRLVEGGPVEDARIPLVGEARGTGGPDPAPPPPSTTDAADPPSDDQVDAAIKTEIYDFCALNRAGADCGCATAALVSGKETDELAAVRDALIAGGDAQLDVALQSCANSTAGTADEGG